MERLKRAVIKEEFIAITGGFEKALILNQFLYWSERVSDFDEFIKQENERAVQQGEEPRELTNGWIYKRAEDLSSETMLNLSKQFSLFIYNNRLLLIFFNKPAILLSIKGLSV